jgi:hypothetical protein
MPAQKHYGTATNLVLLELLHVNVLKEGSQLCICQHLVIEHVHNLLKADAVTG